MKTKIILYTSILLFSSFSFAEEKTLNKVPEFIDVQIEKDKVEKLVPFHAGEVLSWKVSGLKNSQ